MLEKILNSGSALGKSLIAGGMALFFFGGCEPQDEQKPQISKSVQSQPIEKPQSQQPEHQPTPQLSQTQQIPITEAYQELKPKLEIILSGNGTLRDETLELTRGKAELITNMAMEIGTAETTGTEVTYKIKNISDKKIRVDSIDSRLYDGAEEKLRILAIKTNPMSERGMIFMDPGQTLEQMLDIYVNKLKKPYTPGLPIGTLAPGESLEYPFSTGFRRFRSLDKIDIVITTDIGEKRFTSYIPEKAEFPDTK